MFKFHNYVMTMLVSMFVMVSYLMYTSLMSSLDRLTFSIKRWTF